MTADATPGGGSREGMGASKASRHRVTGGGVGWDTCDPELRAWVEATRARLEESLGVAHVGTYLHGSLAAGSYHPPKSDIDVLLVVEGPLDVPQRHRFARAAALMNETRPIVGSLECSVVRRNVLADPLHPMPYEVHFGEELADAILAGTIDLAGHRTDADLAAHVQATCEFGVALSGPPIEEIFTPLPPADFLDSILADLDWILTGEHILESPYYGVLNTARILWVLEGTAEVRSHRLVPSKVEAGEWMLERVPDAHHGVVGLALAAYRDDAEVRPAERVTAGRDWPRDALLGFRDWARERSRGLHGDPGRGRGNDRRDDSHPTSEPGTPHR